MTVVLHRDLRRDFHVRPCSDVPPVACDIWENLPGKSHGNVPSRSRVRRAVRNPFDLERSTVAFYLRMQLLCSHAYWNSWTNRFYVFILSSARCMIMTQVKVTEIITRVTNEIVQKHQSPWSYHIVKHIQSRFFVSGLLKCILIGNSNTKKKR